jgi:thymidylate synthase (FAD)
VTETKRPTSPAAEEILGLYFPILDHGFVSLVDYMGTDECVERAARVSYGYGTRQRSATRGLLRYLRRHKHTTPSEMVELKFHCCMPMFIARQWIRHRTANVNEYSGRYSLMPMLFYTPDAAQLQTQSRQNNQGRSGQAVAAGVHAEALRRWEEIRRQSTEAYGWLTGHEVARELARIDLPLSTYTQWYWKIDLYNLFHFLSLRADAHAQYEIRVYAEAMLRTVEAWVPLAYQAFRDYRLGAATLSAQMLAVVRRMLAGEAVEQANSGLNRREWTELLAALGRDG